MVIDLHFEKLSRYERADEPCTVAVPFPQGELCAPEAVVVFDGDRPVPMQCRATATWPDGSIKWLLVHFLADLPGNAGKTLQARADGTDAPDPEDPVSVEMADGDGTGGRISTGPLDVTLGAAGGRPLLDPQGLIGPWITTPDATAYWAVVDDGGWQTIESGPVRAVVSAHGKHHSPDGDQLLDFTLRVYAYAGKPWVEIAYRVLNAEDAESVEISEIALEFDRGAESVDPEHIQTAIAMSNYRTRIRRSDCGEQLHELIDAEQLLYEGNEQIPETHYGTFWAARRCGKDGSLAVTIHQAQQNFPKALEVDAGHLRVSLWPDESETLTLRQGVAKTHRLLLDFRAADAADLDDINVRSLQFQMPDRPVLDREVYRDAGVIEDVFVDEPVPQVERLLMDLADNRTRGYGMLNWGDGPDAGYTNQGRGKGDLVWTNNEYDLPHAAMMLYARNGERRLLDYLLVAAEHWMDVDVCHHSDDPLRRGGQVVHSAQHVTGGVTVSHEWVEGLLDYYHQTGEPFALDVATGIADNVLRHLENPALNKPAHAQARDTGWALRALVAMYAETHEGKWLEPAEAIVDQFEAWQAEYGAWLAPYTDHTLVRVPFMISVAIISLMKYYRLRPSERVGRLVVDAAYDMIDHCLMPDGRFFYKELPSLRRGTANAQVLGALAGAYEISGDDDFLKAGVPTFRILFGGRWGRGGQSGPKYIAGDAVIWPRGPGPKAFANIAPPVMEFYRHSAQAGLIGSDNGGGLIARVDGTLSDG